MHKLQCSVLSHDNAGRHCNYSIINTDIISMGYFTQAKTECISAFLFPQGTYIYPNDEYFYQSQMLQINNEFALLVNFTSSSDSKSTSKC